MFRDAELGHQRIAADHFLYHLQAHLVQFGGGVFNFFNLRQRELVIGILTPVRLAIHGVEAEAEFGGFFAPVRALGNRNAFHALTAHAA
ncbi:hypothetical protein D3C72_2115810 [compost metagenome]